MISTDNNLFHLVQVGYEGEKNEAYVMTALTPIEFERLLVQLFKKINVLPEYEYNKNLSGEDYYFTVRCEEQAFEILCAMLEKENCHVSDGVYPSIVYYLDRHGDSFYVNKQMTSVEWMPLEDSTETTTTD